jgi:hypothetical protein
MNFFGMKPCLIGVLVLGGADFVAFAREPPARAWIDQRIDKIQPTRKEKRFDEIGWVKGLREGERLAKKSGRPLFLFSNVGELDIGRC